MQLILNRAVFILSRYSLYLILTIALSLVLSSCFPLAPETVEEFDVVATFYDKDAKFGAIKTYAMPDSIMHITSSGTSSSDNISRDYDEIILSQVAANLNALGYTREMDPENNPADVIVTIAITVGAYDLYNPYPFFEYWGWYDGWEAYAVDYESDWRYDYEEYDQQDYELRVGSVIVNMVDPNDPKIQEKEIPSIWIALLNGLAGDTFTSTRSRLLTLINQCFEQSPYLGASS
jgi:hypothetical protein